MFKTKFFIIFFITFISGLLFAQNQVESIDLRGGTLKKVVGGDTLTSILRSNGWAQSQINQVFRVRELERLDLFIGDKYYVTKNQLIFFDKLNDNAYIADKSKKQVEVDYKEVPYRIKTAKHSGKIVGGVMPAINAKVNDPATAQKFINAFILDYNLQRQVHRNAAFEIKYERKYLGDQFIKNGEVLFASLEIGNQQISRRFVQFDNGGAFVDVNGPSNKPLYSPVAYMNVSSIYQPRRRHPITNRISPHWGIDFALPKGEPIYNVAPGRVIRKGTNRAAGNYVVIAHRNNKESFYNHLDTFQRGLKVGDRLRAGDLIGTIGCTGYCTRPHLHFAVKKSGRYVDPATLLKTYPFHKSSKIERFIASTK